MSSERNQWKDGWIQRALSCRALTVDEFGVVRRRRGDGAYALVSPSTHKKTGRVYFNLTFEGSTKSVLVNRVVALALHPNPDNLPEVNHKDGNKQNNAPDNLEWSSRAGNEEHAKANGLKTARGSSNANAKLTPHQINYIRSYAGSNFDCASYLADMFNVSRKTIRDVISGKTWRHL